MSVFGRNYLTKENFLYIKGSPEKMKELSDPKTVPANFDAILDDYTQRGYRVIALGYKKVDLTTQQIQTTTRDQVESNITFLGFLVMQNKLKAATIPTLNTLNKAKVRCIMATGDNMLTALSVGRKAQLINNEETVFLGDLENASGSSQLIWKISTESDQGVKDNLVDEEKTEVNIHNQICPWENLDVNSFSIAVTGKAFEYLKSEPNLRAIYL